MKCYRCSTPIRIKPNAKYCDICRPIVKAEQNAAHKKQIDANRKERSTRAEISRHVPNLFVSSITDPEQMALNRAVDDKHAIPPEPCFTYIPGSAEFIRVSAQITHPKYIRRGLSCDITYLDAEPQGKVKYRRLESVNEL